jgi:hypothetical protein
MPINPLDFLAPPAVALLVAYLALSVWAFVKGWIVPRFIYDKALLRGDKAVEILDSQTAAIEALTTEVRDRVGGRYENK